MAFKKEGAEFTDTVRFKDYALSFAAEEASRFSNEDGDVASAKVDFALSSAASRSASKHTGKIKELRIRMQAPNPSDDLLDDLQRRCDGLVKDFKDANVTEHGLFYSTKGSSGIDLTAPLINEKINDIQGLYSGLPVEESTKQGYVSVEATSTTGRKYASGESKPIKRIIEGIEDFFDSCIDAFQQLR